MLGYKIRIENNSLLEMGKKYTMKTLVMFSTGEQWRRKGFQFRPVASSFLSPRCAHSPHLQDLLR